MKIARLPTGELMEFPPDMPDDEMDRTVRQKLGLPEPPDSNQMLMQLLQAVMQQMEMMSQQLAQSQEAQQMNVQMLAQVSQATAGSADAIQQGFERMERAYLAPRSIVTDKSGKPLGMKIG
jgi:uncharacterized protein YdiU (UPF0061 family)